MVLLEARKDKFDEILCYFALIFSNIFTALVLKMLSAFFIQDSYGLLQPCDALSGIDLNFCIEISIKHG